MSIAYPNSESSKKSMIPTVQDQSMYSVSLTYTTSRRDVSYLPDFQNGKHNKIPLHMLILATVFVLVILNACSGSGWASPPQSAQKPPIHPGAGPIQTKEVDGDYGKPTRIITFPTNADSENILTYYKNTLLQDGWGVADQENPNELHFYWVAGCPVFGMNVLTEPSINGETAVEIEITETPCH